MDTLADALSARDYRVALVDEDPNGGQGGATRWPQQAQANGRGSPFLVVRFLGAKAAAAHDFVIHDHPPGRRAASQLPAGLVLVLERSEQRRLAGALALPVVRDRACYGSLFGMGARFTALAPA